MVSNLEDHNVLEWGFSGFVTLGIGKVAWHHKISRSTMMTCMIVFVVMDTERRSSRTRE